MCQAISNNNSNCNGAVSANFNYSKALLKSLQSKLYSVDRTNNLLYNELNFTIIKTWTAVVTCNSKP